MSDIAGKWGEAVAQRGFAQIPNYLLMINQFLDEEHRLSPVEMLVLLQLVGSWWKKDQMPFPAMSTLAIRCGVSDRQVQRSVGSLEKIGLVRRVKRRAKGVIASNSYDLTPAVEFLAEVAKRFPNEYPRKSDRLKLSPTAVPPMPPPPPPLPPHNKERTLIEDIYSSLLPGDSIMEDGMHVTYVGGNPKPKT